MAEAPKPTDTKEAIIADVERRLQALSTQKLRVEKTDDLITKAYEPLEKVIEDLRTKFDGPEIDQLELRLLKQQYAQRREAYLERILLVEGRNTGKSEWDSLITELFESKLIPYLEIHQQKINQLLSAGVGNQQEILKYTKDLSDIKEDWGKRRRGHFVRIFNEPNVVWGKNRKRIPIEDLTNELVYAGPDISATINEGIMNPEFNGPFSNLILGEKAVDVRAGTLDSVGGWRLEGGRQVLTETAVGWCMRKFDSVYLGMDPDAKNKDGQPITTRNLHSSANNLIDHVYDKLVEDIIGRPTPPQGLEELAALGTNELKKEAIAKKLDRTFVERVFYVHSIATLNHSFLAEDSAIIEDNFYYLFNWLDYCIKYSKAGTGSFNPLVTYSLFGYGGNHYKELLGEHALAEIKAKLQKKNLWEGNKHLAAALGMDGFKRLIEGSMLNVQDVAQGNKPDGNPRIKKSIFASPLRYFVVRDGAGDGARYPDSPDGRKGRILTFDDLQTTNGERLYELMPFDQIGEDYVDYATQISKNGMGLLMMALKAPENEFLSKLDTPDFANTLRNQGKYSMVLFPNVGPMIKLNKDLVFKENGAEFGRIPVGNAIMNETIIRLVYAKCLIQSDPSRETNRWTMNQVKEYLDEMARTGALGGTSEVGYEVAEALEIIVEEGRKWGLRFADLTHSLQEHIAQRGKTHKK